MGARGGSAEDVVGLLEGLQQVADIVPEPPVHQPVHRGVDGAVRVPQPQREGHHQHGLRRLRQVDAQRGDVVGQPAEDEDDDESDEHARGPLPGAHPLQAGVGVGVGI